MCFSNHLPYHLPQMNSEKVFFGCRINLTILFSTKIYLLNTNKQFSGHENRSLGPEQQNLKKSLLGGYPKEPVFQNSEYEVHLVGLIDLGSQNFNFLASKEEAVGVTQILCHTGHGACQMLFSHKKKKFLHVKINNKKNSSLNQYSPYIP
jgi:hypothetical protein